MDRAQKAAAVADLKQTFSEVGVVVVTRNLGLTVAQSTQLRTKMREAGATYKVSKNKLAKIALDGTDYLSLGDMLTGPVGLATSVDPVAAAKVVVDFAKTNDRLEIVGGAMGATSLNVKASRRSRRCRRWMNCVPRLSACWWRPPPSSPRSRRLRRLSSRASSRPMREGSGLTIFRLFGF